MDYMTPYRQSERRDIYRNYVGELIAKGKAYYAFDTVDELEKAHAKSTLTLATMPLRVWRCATVYRSRKEVKGLLERGEEYVVRFLINPGERYWLTTLSGVRCG